jgi:hypothetical protein|eukprot:COSAG01_NODE_4146_length_5299_cov_10.919615_5_plen_95_part_00
MGSPKYVNTRESQPVRTTNDPIIFTRTRPSTQDTAMRTVRVARSGAGVPQSATFDPETQVTRIGFDAAGSFRHDAPAQCVISCHEQDTLLGRSA